MDNDGVPELIQLKVGWHSWSFKLPRTETAKKLELKRKEERNGPTSGQFLLNVRLADYFKLCILFPFLFSHLHPSAREAGRYSNKDTEGTTIQLPTPFSSRPPPSFCTEKCLVQLCKSNPNCSRLSNP